MTSSGKSILLVNPSYASVYKGVKIKEAVPYSPVLSLATIAGPLLDHRYDVRIVDLNMFRGSSKAALIHELKKSHPQYVGITFTTPLYDEMVEICRWVKEYDEGIVIIGGGPHASSLPEETLSNAPLDIVVIGEGDF